METLESIEDYFRKGVEYAAIAETNGDINILKRLRVTYIAFYENVTEALQETETLEETADCECLLADAKEFLSYLDFTIEGIEDKPWQ